MSPQPSSTPDRATLNYARQMIDNGRFDVARRTLSAYPESAPARALLQELDAMQRSGQLPVATTTTGHATNPASVRQRFQYTVSGLDLATAQQRLQVLERPPRRIAPRWQRRFVLRPVERNDGLLRLHIDSRAWSPYEWRYVPARATLRLETVADGVRITGEAQAARGVVAVAVFGVMSALIAAVYVLSINVTLACATSMVLMIGGFYLLPILMQHTRHVSAALASAIYDALHHNRSPYTTPPPLPHTADIATAAATATERLLQLDGRANTAALDWPHRLHLRHAQHADGLRFRLQATPLRFWEWWWTPPDIAGRLEPTPGGVRLHLAENRRTDVLFVMIGVVLLLIGVGATLVGAALWARLLVVVAVIGALAFSFPVAQASMAARNAHLATVLQATLRGETSGESRQ